MKTATYFLIAVLSFCLACGGGGVDDPTGGGDPGLVASFAPDNPSPGPESVSLAQRSSSGNLVTVDVNITDTSGVYGVLFDLVYPAGVTEFVSWSAGDLLGADGTDALYFVDQPVSGRLVVSTSRLGGSPAVNVVGTKTLIRLTFRATVVGNGTVAFENAAAEDGRLPPQDLPIQLWAGGMLGAS